MDKDKERKQDLSGPDEEALEQHVKEMLDITEPDSKPEPEIKEKPADKPKAATKIAVTEHVDEEPASAPKVPKKATKKPVAIAITHDDEKPAPEESPTDSELSAAIEETNKELAEKAGTAPVVAKEKVPQKPKKLTITHFEEPEPATEVPAEPEPVPDETVEETETVTETAPEVTTEEQETPEEPTPDSTEVEEPVVPQTDKPAESPLEPTIDSPATEQAVNDIIATEGDELLAVADEKQAKDTTQAKPTKKRVSLFKHAGFRWALAFVLMAGILAAAVVPSARYAILNTVGVRSSASVIIRDRSTQLPLKGVTVKLAGAQTQTDTDGKAKLEKLRLGPSELVVEKRAFASDHRTETIGWGSNPLADVSLTPTGSQYSFTVIDALSGKPIGNAEATYDDASANADDKGVITLTLDRLSDKQIKVQIKAGGYRDESIDLTLSDKQNITVKMVPAHKISFVSKRSGTYDIYKVDADGKNEQLVLKGTGNEQSNMTLAEHPDQDAAMVIASRSGKRAADNSLLSDLVFVNLANGSTKQVIQAGSLRAIGWIGTRFVYVQTTADAKSDDPTRDKLMSYDYMSGDNRQLATSNYFNDIVITGGKVYYAPSSAYQNGVNLGMFSVHGDGSGKDVVFGKEIWTIARTGYDHFVLGVQQDWYDYTVGGGQPTKLNGQPSNSTSRQYVDSPDGKLSVWMDTRDGKPNLVLYDVNSKTEKVVNAQTGMKGPVRWVGNSALVYRVVTAKETADYVVSINGGDPKKLADVTDTKGIDRYTY